MIVTSLLGLSLVLNVSLDTQMPMPTGAPAWAQISVRQKESALLPLVLRATDCIVRKVSADRRYSNDIRAVDINDLIVDSITACARPVRAMIDAHNRMYGDGSGEAFLLGPYLDVLPAALVRQVKVKIRP
ncbi:MAG: hypothetical protein WCG00_07075 [Hyphomicrobiales bacterium]|nr:hypothetical protein [Hyphomicrobiales bacterium]